MLLRPNVSYWRGRAILLWWYYVGELLKLISKDTPTCVTSITLFTSITLLCGIDNILGYFPRLVCMWEYARILSIPHNIVMDMNNVMLKVSHHTYKEKHANQCITSYKSITMLRGTVINIWNTPHIQHEWWNNSYNIVSPTKQCYDLHNIMCGHMLMNKASLRVGSYYGQTSRGEVFGPMKIQECPKFVL